MINNKVLSVFLVLLILFLGAVTMFVADMVEVIDLEETFPFLKNEAKKLSYDNEPPDALARMELKKEWDKLEEAKESLLKKELEVSKAEEEMKAIQAKLDEMKESLDDEKEKIKILNGDILDKKAKIKDMSGKIGNMPPDSSVDILLKWEDFEIITLFKQMDLDAAEQGEQSLVPYLMTLIDKKQPGRAGQITQKMIQDPKLTVNQIENEY